MLIISMDSSRRLIAAGPAGSKTDRAEHAPVPACTLAPRSPFHRSGVLVMRAYAVTPGGVRYPLPPDAEPKPDECPVPECDCGGAVR